MKIQDVYTYKEYARVTKQSGRYYDVSGTRPLPSVTTVLSSTADKTHLIEWRNKVGHKEAEKITSDSARIGTQLHLNLEHYIMTGRPSEGNYFTRTLSDLIIKRGMSQVSAIWGTEIALYATDLYAGTADAVGVFNGKPAIIDFKNARNERKREWIEDYFLQLVAYAYAHNEMFGTNIQTGVIMMAAHTGKYQEFVIEGDEFKEYEDKWFDRLYKFYSKHGIE